MTSLTVQAPGRVPHRGTQHMVGKAESLSDMGTIRAPSCGNGSRVPKATAQRFMTYPD
jgi:hypothetical protein